MNIDSTKLEVFLKTVCRFSGVETSWALYWINQFIKRYPAWNTSNSERCITAYSSDIEEQKGDFAAQKAKEAVRALFAFADCRDSLLYSK